MATIEECRAALERLAENMSANGSATRERIGLDRTLACRITDLDTAFHGRLIDGRIADLTDGDDPAAKIRLTATSDNLIAVLDGTVPFASAWTRGMIKIDANVFDLIKLRKLL